MATQRARGQPAAPGAEREERAAASSSAAQDEVAMNAGHAFAMRVQFALGTCILLSVAVLSAVSTLFLMEEGREFLLSVDSFARKGLADVAIMGAPSLAGVGHLFANVALTLPLFIVENWDIATLIGRVHKVQGDEALWLDGVRAVPRPFLGGLPVSKDVIEPGGLRMLSSGKEHADLRRLMMQLSPAFDPRHAVDVPLVVPAGARETASGAMRAAKASDDGWDEAWDDDVDLAVARTVAGTLFSAMFNGTLNETEVRWCMQYREFEVVVWLGQPLDQHASGLFSGDVKQLRKKIRDSVMVTPVGSRVQDTVTRMFPHLPAGSSRLAKEIVDTHKRMTDTFLFTGMLSIVSLVRSTLRR
ncbi:unnamed protein product, partial [Symbiodinium sp. KB8]